MHPKTIERISLYRRILRPLRADGVRHVFSHALASMADVSPSLVRRDLMSLDVHGSPSTGYPVDRLIEAIDGLLDAPGGDPAILVGVGHLGRAILAYYPSRQTSLRIVAGFDVDPLITGRIIGGCRVLSMETLEEVVRRERVRLAILTVPADAAQEVADTACRVGVRGILNFAPLRLRVPPEVLVENMDFTITFEKLAYMARRAETEQER